MKNRVPLLGLSERLMNAFLKNLAFENGFFFPVSPESIGLCRSRKCRKLIF